MKLHSIPWFDGVKVSNEIAPSLPVSVACDNENLLLLTIKQIIIILPHEMMSMISLHLVRHQDECF